MDTTPKKVFLSSLSREEQLGTLWDLAQIAKAEHARDKKEHIEIKRDMTFIKGELAGIGRRRDDPTLTTSQKINVALTTHSATWIWYRDRVLAPTLAAVHTLVIMAILYLAFGGKIPTP